MKPIRPLPLIRTALVLAALLAVVAPLPGRAMDRLRYQEYPELEGKTVRQVLILGNNTTREIVFRREMTLREGVPFESDVLWRDWENLVDLGIFAHLEVDAVPSGDGVMVVVSAYERPRWFIAPILDYRLDEREATVGYRLRVRNLGGLNQSFRSDSRVGARDRVNLSWSTPWLGPEPRTLTASLRLQFPEEGNDELRSNRFSLFSTKFVGDYRKLRRGWTSFGRIEVLKRDGTSPFGAVDQLIPSIGLGWFRDSRNVRVDPDRGSLLSFTSEYATGWTSDELSYLRGFGDLRKFVSIGQRIVLAGRGVTVLSTGEVPGYRRVGVGGSRSIRGLPTDTVTGNNLARINLELRFNILPKRRFNLPIPLAPRRIKNFDLRFDGVLFVDTGTAWDDSIGFRNASLFKGFGVGLRVFLPVLEVARIELAFNEDGEPTFYFREGNLI